MKYCTHATIIEADTKKIGDDKDYDFLFFLKKTRKWQKTMSSDIYIGSFFIWICPPKFLRRHLISVPYPTL